MTLSRAILASWRLLDSRDKAKLALASVLQLLLSLLDLAAILLVGGLSALAITLAQGQSDVEAPALVRQLEELVDLTGEELVILLAVTAATLLLVRSIASAIFMRRIFNFLTTRQAELGIRLTKELLHQDSLFVRARSSQDLAHAIVTGTSAAVVLILANAFILVTETGFLIVVALGLVALQPVVSITAVLMFGLLALATQIIMGQQAARLGGIALRTEIESREGLQDALKTHRELAVMERLDQTVLIAERLRWQAAGASARRQFLYYLPRSIYDIFLVLGGVGLSGYLFATEGLAVAFGTLALFLAASARIVPSLLRIQGSALGIREASSTAEPSYRLIRELKREHSLEGDSTIALDVTRSRRGGPDFSPQLTFSNVSYQYPGASRPVLSDVSFSIPAGDSVAVVGRSGAGKTTLADLSLGLLRPNGGTISLGGVPPQDARKLWPGEFGYVPQQPHVVNGTIANNVALALDPDQIDHQRVWAALREASLNEVVKELPDGLESIVGEASMHFSGGQIQRLGIARALYANPSFLVLDEATSALDAQTELAVSMALDGLAGRATRLVIAHRLSTVRSADWVIYLEEGTIAAMGTFAEVCRRVPALATQAELLGLSPDS